MAKSPNLAQLQTILNNSIAGSKNNPLWTVLWKLIKFLQTFNDSISDEVQQNTANANNLANLTFITVSAESSYLPFSRQITAGNDITLDISVPKVIQIKSDPFPEIMMLS